MITPTHLRQTLDVIGLTDADGAIARLCLDIGHLKTLRNWNSRHRIFATINNETGSYD